MTSTDTKAIEAAFIRGFEAGLRQRKPGIPQYEEVRASRSGAGRFYADPELIGDRAVGGSSDGILMSFITALAGGLVGLGLGAAVGVPAEGALAGAGLGAAAGFPLGNAKGQLGADKAYLSNKGLKASNPFPVKELMLRPSVSAAMPLSSYLSIKNKQDGLARP